MINRKEWDETMSQGNWIQVHSCHTESLGQTASMFLFFLADTSKWAADDNGWFFLTRRKVTEKTKLKRTQQDNLIQLLTDLNYLKTDLRGIPSKRHIKLNEKKIIKEMKQYNCAKAASKKAGFRQSVQADCQKPTNKVAGDRQVKEGVCQKPTSSSVGDQPDRLQVSDKPMQKPASKVAGFQHPKSGVCQKPATKDVGDQPHSLQVTNNTNIQSLEPKAKRRYLVREPLLNNSRKSTKQRRQRRVSPAASVTGDKELCAWAKRIAHVVADNTNARNYPRAPDIEVELRSMAEGGKCSRQQLEAAVQWGVENYTDQFAKKIFKLSDVIRAIESWMKQMQKAGATSGADEDAIAASNKKIAEEVRQKRKKQEAAAAARRREEQRRIAAQPPKNCVDMPVDPDLL